jgi:hypothetical protein
MQMLMKRASRRRRRTLSSSPKKVVDARRPRSCGTAAARLPADRAAPGRTLQGPGRSAACSTWPASSRRRITPA